MAGYLDHPEHGRYAFCILQRARPASPFRVASLRAREEEWLAVFLVP